MIRGWISEVTRVPVAELLGVRGWPVVIAWASATIGRNLAIVLGGQPETVVEFLPVTLVVGLAIGLTAIANRLYYHRIEMAVSPSGRISEIPVSWLQQIEKSWMTTSPELESTRVRRNNGTALAIGIPLVVGAISYDLTTFPASQLASPWNLVFFVTNYGGWGYLVLAGVSLFVHYSSRWTILGKTAKTLRLEPPPEPSSKDEWDRWRYRMNVRLESLRYLSGLFFLGFAVLLFALIVETWYWVFFLRGSGILHPWFLVTLVFDFAVIPIYMLSPAWITWRMMKAFRAPLRRSVGELLKIEDETGTSSPEAEMRAGLILEWCNEPALSLRHGNPEAAIGLIVTYLLESVLAVSASVVAV